METLKTLKVASEEQRVERTQVFKSFSKFRCVTSVEDSKHQGHPPTSKTDENVDCV
jgi:hypothetical protein